MPYFFKRPIVFWSFPFLIVHSGCEAKPECDTFETRNAVLQTVSNDHKNPLVKYAAKSSKIERVPRTRKLKNQVNGHYMFWAKK